MSSLKSQLTGRLHVCVRVFTSSDYIKLESFFQLISTMIRSQLILRVSINIHYSPLTIQRGSSFQHLVRNTRFPVGPAILAGNNHGVALNYSTARTIAVTNQDNSYVKNIIKRLGWGSSSKSVNIYLLSSGRIPNPTHILLF